MVETADVTIGKKLIQPYEIVTWKFNKEEKKFDRIVTKVKAIYKLQEIEHGS